MSNYLFFVCRDRESAAAYEWLKQNSDATDLSVHVYGSNFKGFLVSSGAKFNEDGEFYFGYGVDHEGECMYFGGNSSVVPESDFLDGCNIRLNYCDKGVKLQNDTFSMLPIFYFFSDNIFAASDSIYALSALRRVLELDNTPHFSSIVGRSWINAITAQPLSSNTMISEIQFCGVGNAIRVIFDDYNNNLEVTKLFLDPFSQYKAEGFNYIEKLRHGAEEICRFLKTILSIEDTKAVISLSGGLDSRTALAGLMHVRTAGQQFFVGSNSSIELDYEIAQSVTQFLDLPLNQKLSGSKVLYNDQLSSWFISCAGAYDPLYAPRARHINQTIFRISGHGAELYKGNYGWRKISDIGKQLSDTVRAHFIKECQKGLNDIGVCQDHYFGSEWHYVGYRNSIHGGRSVMNNLLGVRPLMNRTLLSISYNDANPFSAPKKNKYSIVSELLILLYHQLATLPFDDRRKNIDRSLVNTRRHILGDLPAIEPYNVIGSPHKIALTSPSFFNNIAREGGADGDIQSGKLHELVLSGGEKIPAAVSSFYESILSEAVEITRHPTKMTTRDAIKVGKILSFNIY